MVSSDLPPPGARGTCLGCGAEIRWVMTFSGNVMPIDPAPAPRGNVVLAGHDVKGRDRVRVLPPGPPSSEEIRYVSHFATCPQASAFRRGDAARRTELIREREGLPAKSPRPSCPVSGCGAELRAGHVLCWKHWRGLGPELRAAITRPLSDRLRKEIDRYYAGDAGEDGPRSCDGAERS